MKAWVMRNGKVYDYCSSAGTWVRELRGSRYYCACLTIDLFWPWGEGDD